MVSPAGHCGAGGRVAHVGYREEAPAGTDQRPHPEPGILVLNQLADLAVAGRTSTRAAGASPGRPRTEPRRPAGASTAAFAASSSIIR